MMTKNTWSKNIQRMQKKGGEVGLECNFIRIQVGQIPTNHDSHSPQLMSKYVDLSDEVWKVG